MFHKRSRNLEVSSIDLCTLCYCHGYHWQIETNVVQLFDPVGRSDIDNIRSGIAKKAKKAHTLHFTVKICFPLIAEAVYLLDR